VVSIRPEDREADVLDEAACLDLLGSASVGRIAFTQDALPAVESVAFAVLERELVIPTHERSRVAVATRGAVVAFQADEFDARDRTGWSVTVVGPSRVVVDGDDLIRMDGLGVRPWTPGPGRCYIGVQVRLVSGQRIRLRPVATGLPPRGPEGTTRAVLPA
jgi:uncharacterized protein